jgi:hypothetical protein
LAWGAGGNFNPAEYLGPGISVKIWPAPKFPQLLLHGVKSFQLFIRSSIRLPQIKFKGILKTTPNPPDDCRGHFANGAQAIRRSCHHLTSD